MPMKKAAKDTDSYDWSQFDAFTDEEVEAQALADPDNFPSSDDPTARMARSQVIRRALGLTQEEFAARYQIPLGTVQDWEQHRSEPDQTARTYLRLIATDPEAVARLLASRNAA